MSADRRAFAEVVRREPVDLGLACLLAAAEADPDVDVRAGVAQLDALADAARLHVPSAGAPAEAAEGLRRALGEQAGFGGAPGEAGDLRASLLPEVLRRRRGLPILLSVVWLEVARRLEVPAHGVGLPAHFLVGVGEPGDAQLVDPFASGRLLGRADADALLRRYTGHGLRPGDLDPTPAHAILLRVLTNVRALSAGRADPSLALTRTHLWAVELSLLLPRHPAALRREHGEVLARLGRYDEAAAELTAYADAVRPADPDAAAVAERAARTALARLS